MPVITPDFAGILKILTLFSNFWVEFGLRKDVLVHISYNEYLKVDMMHIIEKLRLCPFQRCAARFCSFTGRGENEDYF